MKNKILSYPIFEKNVVEMNIDSTSINAIFEDIRLDCQKNETHFNITDTGFIWLYYATNSADVNLYYQAN